MRVALWVTIPGNWEMAFRALNRLRHYVICIWIRGGLGGLWVVGRNQCWWSSGCNIDWWWLGYILMILVHLMVGAWSIARLEDVEDRITFTTKSDGNSL